MVRKRIGGMTCAVVALLGFVVVVLSGCGGSHKAFACPVTRGHDVSTPLTGRLVVLGRPPVEVRVDNRGDLRSGVTVLAASGYRGWFALKSHFLTPPSFQGGFTVHVRQLGGAKVGLGDSPPGGSFTAAAGPAPNESGGWRDFVGGWTWVRTAGCYDWEIVGQNFRESVVTRAELP